MSLLLGYLAGFFVYKNHRAKVARKFFTFEVPCADQTATLKEELASIISNAEKFFEFLKYESLEESSPMIKITSEEIRTRTPPSERRKVASKLSLPVLPKAFTMKQPKAFRKSSKQRFELECGCMIFCFLVYLTFTQCFASCRFVVMMSRSGPILHLLQAFRNSIEMYNSFVSLNMCLCELFLWNDQTRIAFRKPSEFYRAKRDQLVNTDLPFMASLGRRDGSEVGALYQRLTETPMSEILRLSADSKEPLPGIETAIAGIAQKPMASFLQHYANICDQMLLEWGLCSSPEQRRDVLSQPQYTSLLAYSVYNSLGTGDAMYYFLIYPIYTDLQQKVLQISATLDLSNLVSMAAFLLLGGLLGCPMARMFHRSYASLYLAVYCVPIRALDGHPLMKQALRVAEQKKNFEYF